MKDQKSKTGSKESFQIGLVDQKDVARQKRKQDRENNEQRKRCANEMQNNSYTPPFCEFNDAFSYLYFFLSLFHS